MGEGRVLPQGGLLMGIVQRSRTRIALSGRVISGKGEGRYYMRQMGYRRQFIARLGIDPYIGTLNIKLSKKSCVMLAKIKAKRGMLVKGFTFKKKKFGDVSCYRAMLRGIGCILIAPRLSPYTEIAELIAPSSLRRLLKLKNGAVVRIAVFVK
ncbi:MAG: CTP-dependent riboflavin kinase [Candidatus Micrarchaeota archaeon]|nr:CTP-dependent riboflavin kinase [Candidatus Micrarchaeota archaeon]MDE1847605.1 CTP-dependent riboflavin kinase [Candidatus Micrarchaeota archaeon]MDE1863808.1 CTP-dependent riboflavin kinase [Candidatus Micrarchaeota archaeon]